VPCSLGKFKVRSGLFRPVASSAVKQLFSYTSGQCVDLWSTGSPCIALYPEFRSCFCCDTCLHFESGSKLLLSCLSVFHIGIMVSGWDFLFHCI